MGPAALQEVGPMWHAKPELAGLKCLDNKTVDACEDS